MTTDEPPISAPETAPYLVSPSLRQRLDLIHHLIGFGRQIIVVRGEPGSGRSRLIATVCDEANPDWLVIEIGGQGVDSPSQLLDVLLDALEPGAGERPHSAEDQEARVCRQLAEMHSEHRVAVLLVDDCDAFNAEINALLFRLAYTDNGVGELRVVLSCSASTPYLEGLQAQSPQATLLHVVDVPALSDAEITNLAERFGPGPQALDAYTIAALAERCRGNPGRLLEILASAPAQATEHHAPPAEIPPVSTPGKPAGGGSMKQVAGVVLVVFAAVGLAALTLVNRERGSVAEPGIELPLREMPGAVAPPVSDTTQIVGDEPPSPPTEIAAGVPVAPLEPDLTPAVAARPAATDATAPGTAPAPEPATQSRQETADARQQQGPISASPPSAAKMADRATIDAVGGTPPKPLPAAPAAAAEKRASSSNAAGEPVAAVPAPPPAPPAAAPTSDQAKSGSASPKPPKVPTYSPEWVLTQDDKSYVIQLFGVRDRRAAERFIKSARLSDKAAVFDLVHESAPWYVVTLGHYRDRAAARAAIAALPVPLRASGPWARSVASLRE